MPLNGVEPQTIKPGKRQDLLQWLRSSEYYIFVAYSGCVYLKNPLSCLARSTKRSAFNNGPRRVLDPIHDFDPLATIGREKVNYLSSPSSLFHSYQLTLSKELSDFVV